MQCAERALATRSAAFSTINVPDMTNSNVSEICTYRLRQVLRKKKINNNVNILYFTIQRDGMKMRIAGLTQNEWTEGRK